MTRKCKHVVTYICVVLFRPRLIVLFLDMRLGGSRVNQHTHPDYRYPHRLIDILDLHVLRCDLQHTEQHGPVMIAKINSPHQIVQLDA